MKYRQVDVHVGKLGDTMHKNKTNNKNHSSNKHFWPKLIDVGKIKIASLRTLDQVYRTKVVVLIVLDKGEGDVGYQSHRRHSGMLHSDLRQACKEAKVSYLLSSMDDYQVESQQLR